MRNLVSNSFVWIGAALGVVGISGAAADFLIASGQSFWLVEYLAAIGTLETISTAAAAAAVGGISSKTKAIDTSSIGSKRNIDSPERSHKDQNIAIEQERLQIQQRNMDEIIALITYAIISLISCLLIFLFFSKSLLFSVILCFSIIFIGLKRFVGLSISDDVLSRN